MKVNGSQTVDGSAILPSICNDIFLRQSKRGLTIFSIELLAKICIVFGKYCSTRFNHLKEFQFSKKVGMKLSEDVIEFWCKTTGFFPLLFFFGVQTLTHVYCIETEQRIISIEFLIKRPELC